MNVTSHPKNSVKEHKKSGSLASFLQSVWLKRDFKVQTIKLIVIGVACV